MKFEFIDNNGAVDGAVRKQIRSRAAKGHNLGRRLSRPSKKKAFDRPSRTQLQVIEPSIEPSTETTSSVHFPRSLSALPAHWKQQHDEGPGRLALIQRGEDVPCSVRRCLCLTRLLATLFIGGIRHPPELDVALDYSSEPRTRWVQPLFVNEAC